MTRSAQPELDLACTYKDVKCPAPPPMPWALMSCDPVRVFLGVFETFVRAPSFEAGIFGSSSSAPEAPLHSLEFFESSLEFLESAESFEPFVWFGMRRPCVSQLQDTQADVRSELA